MNSKIGQVTLDYSYNKNTDTYSDGDIEDELLEMVKQEKDVLKILEHDHRWPILYHLSPIRQNIVEWYHFHPDSDCLEVGSGCGAITGALARKLKTVDCIDISERRSMINAYRNRDCDNLTIYVANFNDFNIDKKYDYVTLIGVLEYAAYYTPTDSPSIDFLKNIYKRIKKGGRLLIAIENKYGLKYWNGRAEDHTGMLFEGITGYGHTDSKVRTYSKDRLQTIVEEAGFCNIEFYYPYPDYKFPRQIFSDEHLPSFDELVYDNHVYDNHAFELFEDRDAYMEILSDGRFDYFSNSFFVEAEVM